MVASTKSIACLPLLAILVMSRLCCAQSDSTKFKLAHTEYRAYPTHFEQIKYNGKHQEYFTVKTFLPDSTLYRIDNYKKIDEVSMYGYQYSKEKVAVRHGQTKIMYPDGQPYLTCEYIMNALNGPFMVYYRDGSLKRRQLYKEGRIKEGHCYTADGEEKPCEDFYQLPQFTGDRNGLKSYLEKNFQSLVDGQTVRFVQIKLTINEIGQISNTTIESNQKTPMLLASVQQTIRNLPHWNEQASDWKPAITDGTPISDIWTIYIYRRNSFLYVTFP